ncbi:hypothetical protein BRC79_04580 [Halobacteriales archaeon QH_8_67_27]|nr:MAG: hypothetical protein BRC79_04580 [Halobacteriales archaeon QH_8_67_27]
MSVLDGLLDRVRGGEDRAWAGSVEALLFDGESIRQRVELDDGNRVVVTSHRLLAFTPGSDGENYRGVDLPNVADVRAGHEGERNLLWQGSRTLLYGLVLLGVGVFLDFDSFVPTDAFQRTGATSQLGMGGLLGLLQQFLDLIARIDEFARTIGALLVLFAVFVFAVYLLTRDRVLVVGVAGDDANIRVPADGATIDGAVADLEVTLSDTGATTGADAAERADSGVTETGAAKSDPLGPESGAVRSDGITGGSGSSSADAGVHVDEEGASEPAGGQGAGPDVEER